MGFSDRQTRALQRGVKRENIRTRKLEGLELHYIEGWFAIAEANRIFGFDGWDRETLESKCIVGREVRGSFLAIYTAKVRVTVRSDGATVVREGSGSGEAKSASLGEAHEVGLKAAETDATKRALATFGRPFGLALYLNGRPNTPRQGRERPPETPAVPAPLPSQQPPPLPAAALPAIPSIPAPTTGNGHPPKRIDKSLLAFGEPRRERDKHHLIFVATQPCLICSRAPCDAHHLRFAQTRTMGRKVGDQFTVPLCRTHHAQLHESSDEAAWWNDLEIDAIEIAKGLWEESRAKRAALVRNLPGSVDPLNPQLATSQLPSAAKGTP